MKKRTIVIASILKPVDDTRMFEKMAVTLAGQEQFEVHIIGRQSKPISAYSNIHFHPIGNFSRISIERAMASLRVYSEIRKVKPELIIVNTHELLIVAIVNRIFFGARIMYDIRENYLYNILYTNSFPEGIRSFLAGWVRLKEVLLSPFLHHFILSESGYQHEMSFFGRRFTVISNKAIVSGNRPRELEAGKLRLLFSGTLAESTGAFQAIELARLLHSADPTVELTIVGHCHMPATLVKLRTKLESYMTLIGGDRLVPHSEIVDAIYKSDFGIVAYPPSPHTENAIPTKLYEYLACRLPILIQTHPVWVDLCSTCSAALVIDFDRIDPAQLLSRMRSSNFYTRPPSDVTWQSEGVRLLELIRKVLP